MALRLRVPSFVLLSALTLALPAAAEDAKPKDFLKTPPTGTAFELTEDGVRIPLALDDAAAPMDLDPEVKVLDAALGTQHNPAFVTAFKPQLQDGAVVFGPPAATLRPGAYDVKLEIRPKPAKTGFKSSQTLDLRLTVPAATLQPPGTLVMERSLGLAGYGDQEKLPVLFLKETAGHGLAQVAVEQIGWQTIAKDVGAARLACPAVDAIPPGRVGHVTCSLQNVAGLPLGTVQGLAEIRAPQLAAAVPLSFEIHTRRRLWWVPICVALGLICGWVLRTTLPKLVARDQARLQGIDVLDRIDRESGVRKDPDFKTKLAAIRSTLERAVNDSKLSAEDLTKAVNAATDALNQETAALNGRLAAAQKEVERLDKLVRTHWSLPPEMANVLAAEADLNSARQALQDSNAKGASDVVKGALARFVDLPRQIQTWMAGVQDLLDGLTDPERPVPAGLAEGLKASVTHVRGLLDAIPDPGAAPEAEGLIQAFDALDKARRDARLLLLRLAGGFDRVLAGVQTALEGATLKDPKAFSDALEAAKKRIEKLRAVAEVPEAGSDDVVQVLDGFDGDLRRGLLAQVAEEDGKKAVVAKLDQRTYGAAAREVARQLVAAQQLTREGPRLGSTTQPEGAPVPEATWAGSAEMRQLFPQWDALPSVLNLAPGMLSEARLRVSSELRRITLLRTVLVAIGLLLLSLVLYHDRIGTWNDVAEVFFWAFGIDVTVDAFWTAAKTLKKT